MCFSFRKRFFSIFRLKETGARQINIKELIFIISLVGICFFLVSIVKIKIDTIIDINGAVLGFCFIYLIPSLLHIRCVYFSKGKKLLQPPEERNELNEEKPSDRADRYEDLDGEKRTKGEKKVIEMAKDELKIVENPYDLATS